jgi:hypothetical protein
MNLWHNRKIRIGLIILLLTVTLLLLSVKTKADNPFISVNYYYANKYSEKRGLRNNNPLNIRSYETWLGQVGHDGKFVKFKHPAYGIRAGMKILLNYYNKYGLKNINSIIHRFAPPNENNTEKYVSDITNYLKSKGYNVTKYTDLKLNNNKNLLIDMIKGMIKEENSINPYPDSYFEMAYKLKDVE